MLAVQVFENSLPDGVPVLEVVTPHNTDQLHDDAPRLFVPLKRTAIRGEVVGPLAALKIVHVYGYAAAQCPNVLEAVYRFPLPGDAAVTGVVVKFGEVEVRAELKERQQAEAAYEEAKAAGHQAVLTTRESSSVFTLHVAGIKPGEDVEVETTYVQLARPEGGGWSLRIPLTTAPRYVRADEAGSRAAAGNPLAVLRDPGHRFALDVDFRAVSAVNSPTHALLVDADGESARVRLRGPSAEQGGEVVPDRDCVLAWTPAGDTAWPSLTAIVHDDPAGGWVYFLAMVVPPATRQGNKAFPRESVLLVDCSGSMRGPKADAARWAAERFLAGLGGRDLFALGLFDNTTTWYSPSLLPAAGAAGAVDYMKKEWRGGGTELGVALEQALRTGRCEGQAARHVLIVTDAQVSDEGRLLRLVDAEAARPAGRRRVSILCIDAAPNSHFVHDLAERGGGVAKFLTSDPGEGDIATALDAIMADWGEPALVGLRLGVGRPGVEAAGRSVRPPVADDSQGDGCTVDLGDLPYGRPTWVVGRAPRGDGGPLQLTLGTPAGVLTQVGGVPDADPAGPALKALFGARRVLALEHMIASGLQGADLDDALVRLGYSLVQVLHPGAAATQTVYHQNAHDAARKALRGLLVREAIDFGLASSETAFVAVRTEAGQPVQGTAVVANALPHGWSDGFEKTSGGIMSLCAASAGPQGTQGVQGSAGPRGLAGVKGWAGPLGLAGVPGLAATRAAHTLMSGGPRGQSAAMSFDVAVGRGGDVNSRGLAAPSAFPASFAGVPAFDAAGMATLVDIADGGPSRLVRLTVGRGWPAAAGDPRITVYIFVGDLGSPRAAFGLWATAVRPDGRPLNIAVRPGDAVRVVLSCPAGLWPAGAPVAITLHAD